MTHGELKANIYAPFLLYWASELLMAAAPLSTQIRDELSASNDDALYESLHRYWGYESFRPGQEAIVRCLAAGRDACVIMPTVNPETITPHAEAFQAVVWHLLVSHPKLKANQTKWESAVR